MFKNAINYITIALACTSCEAKTAKTEIVALNSMFASRCHWKPVLRHVKSFCEQKSERNAKMNARKGEKRKNYSNSFLIVFLWQKHIFAIFAFCWDAVVQSRRWRDVNSQFIKPFIDFLLLLNERELLIWKWMRRS